MFIIRSLNRLLDKIFFAALLLLGMQIPNFVMQYQQTLAAHFHEAQQQLQQYQTVADRFYRGDLGKLLAVHRTNDVEAIRAEAEILDRLLQRNAYLRQQINALSDKQLHQQMLHFLKQPDLAIAEEVYRNYRPVVPLNAEALITGVTLAIVLNMAVHIALALVMRCFTPDGGKPNRSNTLEDSI